MFPLEIAQDNHFHYDSAMVTFDPDRIRDALRKEVPAFQGTGEGFLGNSFMLIGSIGLASIVGLATVWLFCEMMETDYEDSTLVAGMIIFPVLGFVVGFLTRDNPLLPGQSSLTSSASDHENELGGCLLAFLHMLSSSIYSSFTRLFSGFGKDRSGELELAVSIISHLLHNGATPTSKLAESLTDQGVPRDRVRDTLGLLRQEQIVEPDEKTLRLSPSVKPLFL